MAALSVNEVALEPDPREARRRRGVFQVTAGTVEDATLVEVRLAGTSEIVEVEVASEDKAPTPTPTRLMFSQASYRIHPGKSKMLVLMAPVDSVAQASTVEARLTTTHDDIRVPKIAALELRDAGDGRQWYEAEITAVATASASGRVRAALGDQAAVCQISAADDKGRLPFEIDVQDAAPRYDSQGRAEWSLPKGVLTLRVFASHPSLAPYFGKHLDTQDSREARIMLAEVVANELATYTLLETDRETAGALLRDARTFSTRLKEIAAEYLPVAHRSLVPEMMDAAP